MPSRFIDWLREGGFRLWQMLPVGPVGESLSPYQMSSAFAGNPRLIDPDSEPVAGWLPSSPAGRRRFLARRAGCCSRRPGCAFGAGAGPEDRADYNDYWQAQRAWLLPFALFRVARRAHGESGWWTWPDGGQDSASRQRWRRC